ncbi:MAG: short-chain dehydrogenase/reductase [Rhodospirillales bacterium]|nr:short-chain dehydrogenase/reductase [Rhodospirillales bacterium]
MSRTAIVTGAGGGIGRAIAEALAADEWAVIGFDRWFSGEHPHLNRMVEQDIADSVSFRTTLLGIVDKVAITGLVNCAGISMVGRFVDSSEDGWRKLVDINFIAPLTACQAVLPHMIENGEGGAIVNITSDSARIGAAGEAVYSGTKGGLAAFSKSLAQEIGRFGITVNCVSPGIVATPMSASNADVIAKLVRKVPMKRVGLPTDIAGAVAFLLNPQANYITGQILSVGGGLTMAG